MKRKERGVCERKSGRENFVRKNAVKISVSDKSQVNVGFELDAFIQGRTYPACSLLLLVRLETFSVSFFYRLSMWPPVCKKNHVFLPSG
jgi:hypothetical protein